MGSEMLLPDGPSGSNVPWVWVWYGFMVSVCAVGNILLTMHVWRKAKQDTTYEKTMKYLALPWVANCAWRSVFPSLYLQRYVWWNTPLNAIIVDRGFACVGELCWVFQTALALRHIDIQVTGGRRWIQASAWFGFAVYVVAECVSYYNVATTNEYYCAVEVVLDGFSYLCFAPGSIYLLGKCPGGLLKSSAKVYLAIMSVACPAYMIYNAQLDAPMYIQRWKEDQAHHKKYLHFLPGLVDAAVRRVPTHKLADWEQDMSWMIMYFTLGAWSGIAMMYAPKAPKTEESEELKTVATFENGPAAPPPPAAPHMHPEQE